MSELWIRCPTAGALLADDSYPWASSHASRAEHKHLGKVQFLLYLCSRKNQKRRLLESCSTERTVFAVLIFFGESCTQNLFLCSCSLQTPLLPAVGLEQREITLLLFITYGNNNGSTWAWRKSLTPPPTPPLSLRCYDSAYCTCGLVPNMGSMVYSIGSE